MAQWDYHFLNFGLTPPFGILSALLVGPTHEGTGNVLRRPHI
jgi:hypothetical protein